VCGIAGPDDCEFADDPHENARRLDDPAAGRPLRSNFAVPALDHAEHDGANKGEGNIRGKDTELTDESHGKAPLVSFAAHNNAPN
jgi:hypothetical protein